MNTKKIFLTSASICTVCIAILLTESVFSGFANAAIPKGDTNFDIRQRIEDLETAQDENDKEFFLIDTSLTDLDLRVLELEKRAEARANNVNAISKRLATLRASIRTTKRASIRDLGHELGVKEAEARAVRD